MADKIEAPAAGVEGGTAAREQRCAPVALPTGLAGHVAGRRWHRDLVGEAGCAVHRLERAGDRDLYLKHGAGGAAGDVLDEAVRLRWLYGRLPVPRIRHVEAGAEGAWLLTDALPGRTAWQMLDADPRGRGGIVDALADLLRRFHALPVERCPFEAGHPFRLAQARNRLEAGSIDEDDFDAAHEGWSAEQLWQAMTALLPFAPERVVTHGDFSLDNIVFGEGGAAGCLDVGRCGVADRYQDVAILWSCLGEFDVALQARFLARYGIATLDERRLRFHLMLDECF